jgi:hypothetical protein
MSKDTEILITDTKTSQSLETYFHFISNFTFAVRYLPNPFHAGDAVRIPINSAHCINEDFLIFDAYPLAGLQVLLGSKQCGSLYFVISRDEGGQYFNPRKGNYKSWSNGAWITVRMCKQPGFEAKSSSVCTGLYTYTGISLLMLLVRNCSTQCEL